MMIQTAYVIDSHVVTFTNPTQARELETRDRMEYYFFETLSKRQRTIRTTRINKITRVYPLRFFFKCGPQ
jgi:hypothetical protein